MSRPQAKTSNGLARHNGHHNRIVSELQLPPQNLDAERTVLGALLVDNAAFDKIGDLQPKMLYAPHHQIIARAIWHLLSICLGNKIFRRNGRSLATELTFHLTSKKVLPLFSRAKPTSRPNLTITL